MKIRTITVTGAAGYAENPDLPVIVTYLIFGSDILEGLALLIEAYATSHQVI